LNGFLGEHLAVYADVASEWVIAKSKSSEQRRRQDEGLKTAREISAQKRSEKARQQHENIRRMAFEYFRSRPADHVDAAIAHIGKYVRLSRSTIMATIKGVRAEALRRAQAATERGKFSPNAGRLPVPAITGRDLRSRGFAKPQALSPMVA